MPSMTSTEPTKAAVVRLPVLEYSKLVFKDKIETQRLQAACESHGFFYLDLRDTSDGEVVRTWNQVLTLMDEYFDQTLETKMLNSQNSDQIGYEPVGTSAGAVANHKDGYESLKISREQVLRNHEDSAANGYSKLAVAEHLQGLCHNIAMVVLSRLSDALALEGGDRFESSHQNDKPSKSTLAMFRYPKQFGKSDMVGHNKHTDLGTLTVLLCKQWGLQVLSPETDTWGFVEPLPGHAIINVGDSLRFLSEKKLLSAVHRVVPRGAYQEENRSSIAYFLRPQDGTMYRDSNEVMVSAESWHDTKFNTFRLNHDEQEKDSILCGGMERGEVIVGQKA